MQTARECTNLSKTNKIIPIPKVEESVEDLLKGKQVKVTKPPKKKETRGRPRKKTKPTWQPKVYSASLIAQGINAGLLAFFNATMLKQNPIKKDEIMVGEASAYLMDYYGLTPDHPIIVFAVATGLFGKTVIDHSAQIVRKKKKQAGIPKERTEKVA